MKAAGSFKVSEAPETKPDNSNLSLGAGIAHTGQILIHGVPEGSPKAEAHSLLVMVPGTRGSAPDLNSIVDAVGDAMTPNGSTVTRRYRAETNGRNLLIPDATPYGEFRQDVHPETGERLNTGKYQLLLHT